MNLSVRRSGGAWLCSFCFSGSHLQGIYVSPKFGFYSDYLMLFVLLMDTFLFFLGFSRTSSFVAFSDLEPCVRILFCFVLNVKIRKPIVILC